MSKGLGIRQNQVLEYVRSNGGPILSVDLAVGVWRRWGGRETANVPYAFYEGIRRASAGLVKRGMLRSGRPLNGRRSRTSFARAVYWIPEHDPPKLDPSRKIPGAIVRIGVLKALAEGPLPYSSVVNSVGKHLAADAYEYEALRTPISRAVSRLIADGLVRRRADADGDTLSVVL